LQDRIVSNGRLRHFKGLSDAKEHTRLEENLPPYYNVFMLLITSRPLTIPFCVPFETTILHTYKTSNQNKAIKCSLNSSENVKFDFRFGMMYNVYEIIKAMYNDYSLYKPIIL